MWHLLCSDAWYTPYCVMHKDPFLFINLQLCNCCPTRGSMLLMCFCAASQDASYVNGECLTVTGVTLTTPALVLKTCLYRLYLIGLACVRLLLRRCPAYTGYSQSIDFDETERQTQYVEQTLGENGTIIVPAWYPCGLLKYLDDLKLCCQRVVTVPLYS